MPKSYFITGTDTNIGKTFVTCGIASALRHKGVNVGVMKPVESGCQLRDGKLIPEDACALKDAAGSADDIDLINPYRLTRPLAPSLASRLEGVHIDFNKIKTNFEEISKKHAVTLVEGAGGFLVPLTDELTVADLARYVGLPLIIIAPSRLGVVNHTALTVECAHARGIEVAGIILNNPVAPDMSDLSRDYNHDLIERLTGVPVIAEVPYKKEEAPFRKEEGLFEVIISKL